jgi:hypothetical protein
MGQLNALNLAGRDTGLYIPDCCPVLPVLFDKSLRRSGIEAPPVSKVKNQKVLVSQTMSRSPRVIIYFSQLVPFGEVSTMAFLALTRENTRLTVTRALTVALPCEPPSPR